jgi:saccharopine dehydrogenase-like NADP-dependent oxidoreductase
MSKQKSDGEYELSAIKVTAQPVERGVLFTLSYQEHRSYVKVMLDLNMTQHQVNELYVMLSNLPEIIGTTMQSHMDEVEDGSMMFLDLRKDH